MAGAQIGGVALVGLVALLMLRQYKPEWAAFIRIAVTVVAVGFSVTRYLILPDFMAAMLVSTWKALGVALTKRSTAGPFSSNSA